MRSSRKISPPRQPAKRMRERLDAEKGIAEPVPFLPFAEQDFPADHGQAEQAKPEGIEALVLPAHGGALGLEIRRIDDDDPAEKEGEQADGEIEIEDPAPAVVIRDEAAERRPDDGGEQRGDAEDGHGRALFFLREGVEQDALAGGLQAAAGEALQDARGDEHGQARGHAAEDRGERENGDGPEEIIAPPKPHSEPAGDRQHDGIRGQIAGNDPLAVTRRGRKAAGHVAQGHIGDRGIQDLHEGGDDHRERDNPRIENPCDSRRGGRRSGRGGDRVHRFSGGVAS